MIWVFTSAFCKYEMLSDCITNLRLTQDLDYKHVIIDQHYPVDKDYNRQVITSLAKNLDHGIYIDSKFDRGLHRGLNHAMEQLNIQPDDIIITCDPDDRPSPGAFAAMTDVMRSGNDIAVLGLNFSVIQDKIKKNQVQMKEGVLAGHTVLLHPNVEMWNVAAYNTRLILENGFNQPNGYYGGIEIDLFHKWRPLKKHLGYLKDFNSEFVPVDRTNPNIYDQEYGAWKIHHALHGDKRSFEEYLNETGNNKNTDSKSQDVGTNA